VCSSAGWTCERMRVCEAPGQAVPLRLLPVSYIGHKFNRTFTFTYICEDRSLVWDLYTGCLKVIYGRKFLTLSHLQGEQFILIKWGSYV
jgi:hypothetical protein